MKSRIREGSKGKGWRLMVESPSPQKEPKFSTDDVVTRALKLRASTKTMGEAPYPQRTGKGRKEFLPTEMRGSQGQTLKPYGGLTGQEFMDADPKPSTMPDLRVSNPNGMDQEELGNEILKMLERTRLQEARNGTPERDEITASRAADVIMGIGE